MGSIAKRIERAEEKLGLDQGPTVINIVMFGDGPLPPERRDGNIITRYVAYESIREHLEGGAEHEH